MPGRRGSEKRPNMKKLVIIPAYNERGNILKTVEDVKKNAPDFDYVVINDCSTDNTKEVVKPFLSDGRVRFFQNEKNCGAALSRNRALREAQGEWIAFLDSDDLWMPDKLEKQIAFMMT